MITEKVFSPYHDKDIKKNLNDSEIWNKAFKQDELTNEIKDKYKFMYLYVIKFEGLTPKQVNKVKLIKF